MVNNICCYWLITFVATTAVAAAAAATASTTTTNTTAIDITLPATSTYSATTSATTPSVRHDTRGTSVIAKIAWFNVWLLTFVVLEIFLRFSCYHQ